MMFEPSEEIRSWSTSEHDGPRISTTRSKICKQRQTQLISGNVRHYQAHPNGVDEYIRLSSASNLVLLEGLNI